MAINFPLNPTLNQEFTSDSTTWIWDGDAWNVKIPNTLQIEELVANSVTATASELTVSNANITFLTVDETVDTTNLEATGTITTNNLIVTGTTTGIDVSLNDLTDVTAPNPSNLQQLRYSTASSSWVAFTPEAGVAFNGGTIINPLFINNTAESVDGNSGALRVAGGASVAGDLFVDGTITVLDESLELRARSDLKFYNLNNSRNGNLSWASAAGAGGGTPPGGLDTQVQFNNNGSFGGNAGLTFDLTSQILTVPNQTVTGTVDIQDTTESIDTATGSLITAGGAGIAGQLNVAGATNKFTGDTESTSINTGTIIVTGGMGVSGNVNVGSNIGADAAPTLAEHLTNKRYVDANILAFAVAFGA
jgi:hypothetical protein